MYYNEIAVIDWNVWKNRDIIQYIKTAACPVVLIGRQGMLYTLNNKL